MKEHFAAVFFFSAGQDDFDTDFPMAWSSSHMELEWVLLAYSIFSQMILLIPLTSDLCRDPAGHKNPSAGWRIQESH